MTTDEKLQIFRDRLSGLSYKEIEKKYGGNAESTRQLYACPPLGGV